MTRYHTTVKGNIPFTIEEELARNAEEASAILPVTPSEVTMRQARIALLQAGLLSTVNSLIAAMPGIQGEAARIEWEYSMKVERNRELVATLGPALNLTDIQLDNLFIQASKL